jgi:glutaminyl-tRNA synthetase
LEFCVREDLNKTAIRAMAVLNPIKVVISNYPTGQTEKLNTENNPEDLNAGVRTIPFSNTLYIEREDFRERANNKFFRLKLGGEVRLKSAYIIKAESVKKDASGNVETVYCTYDPKSLSGSGTPESLRKVKATIHWVSSGEAKKISVRQYDRLFNTPSPEEDKDVDFMTHLNPNSLSVQPAFAESMLSEAKPGDHFQFQRLGYFVCDQDSSDTLTVFNKTVGLRDTWSKQQRKPETQPQQTNIASPLDTLRKLGKKFTSYNVEKQSAVANQISALAKDIPKEDLATLYNTATKKTGTRIAVAIVLAAYQQEKTPLDATAIEFVEKARTDKNPLLIKYAENVKI